jgi:hypothetical protein
MQDSFFDFNLVSWYKCDVHFYVHKGRKEFVPVSLLLTSALDSLLMRVQVGSARVEAGSKGGGQGGQWRVEEKASSVIYNTTGHIAYSITL